MSTRAVYGGSFDPFTNGHLHIVQKAARIFDNILVVVAENKSKNCMFSAEERKDMIEKTIRSEALPHVDISIVEGQFLANYAKSIKATHLIRGLPNVADFQYEYDMYHENRNLSETIETVFFMCDKDIQQVRSSTVRNMIGLLGWMDVVKEKVPPFIFDELLLKYMKEKWGKLVDSLYGRQGMRYEGWHNIKEAYKGKPYHNFEHICRMLEFLKRNNINNEKLELTVWFHDIDKKELVAAETMSEFGCRWFPWNIDHEYCKDVICATDPFYKKKIEEEDAKLLVCADREILASDWKAYEKYAFAVRAEYPQYDDEKWAEGRIKVLERLLELDDIFPHEKFKKLNARARNNITKEKSFLERELKDLRE